MTRRDAIMARIRARCVEDPVTGCLEWTGPTSGVTKGGGGYPRMCLDGRTVAVHRVVAAHAFGYLHPGVHVDHKCRNRRCVAPGHLEVVSPRENCRRRDAAKAGAE